MILNSKAAQAFLNSPKTIKLSSYTQITKEAAELLSSYSGCKLELSGLRELSQDAAAAIGAFKGDLLLDSLEDPSPAAIEELTERSWNPVRYLRLDGIEHIDEHQAMALTAFRGKLGLRGLSAISNSCAKILGMSSAYHLYLDGLKTLTARALKHVLGKRSIVSLNGLIALPDNLGDLANFKENVEELYLNGLEASSSESLKNIALVSGESLYLNRLKSLPQTDAMLFKECVSHLYLDGIEKLTDNDVKALGTNLPTNPLSLGGLEELDARQASELIGADRGSISIGLRTMSDDVASVLFRSESYWFGMDRLEWLSPFAAELCGKFIHAEMVSFGGLRQISDEAFALLLADYSDQAKDWCPGFFNLDGLEQLTPRMRDVLAATKNSVSLQKVGEYKS